MISRSLIIYLAAVCCPAYMLSACHEQPAPIPAPKKQEHSFSVNGSVREIKIHPENPDFPEHEGKAEFVSYCAICHSLKFISMQPDFPRKTWEAEVTKMIVKYKAPIDSVVSRKIIDYLVAIKSKE